MIKKKLMAVGLTAALAATMLAGCGNSGGNSAADNSAPAAESSSAGEEAPAASDAPAGGGGKEVVIWDYFASFRQINAVSLPHVNSRDLQPCRKPQT